MSRSLKSFAVSTLAVATIIGHAGSVSASPPIDRLAIKNASSSAIEPIQWRGWGWGWGWAAPAVAGGVLAGALVGSALAAPYYYGPWPYYYYPRPYYAPAPAGYYAPAPGADAVAYCLRRFKSYNPRTGTYRGSDGHRHPCP